MTSTILYYIIDDDLSTEYALDILTRRLEPHGISLQRVDLVIDERPLLEMRHRHDLGEEAFTLQWFPDIDPHLLLDEDHALTLDRSSEIAGLYAGQKERAHTGRICARHSAGLVYAILELCDLCDIYQGLPSRFVDLERSPKLAVRSACLLLMKAGAYDLDIVEAEFPWFYDRLWWMNYLDFLVDCRYNAVTIWNYFPFPYFVSVPGYEHCAPISEDQLLRNQRMMTWLNQQFACRNLTMVFHFYCIYVPKLFADSIGMPQINQFSEEQQPMVYDYISANLRAFAQEYDSIGVMPCLGEGIPGGDAERFAEDVIVPALSEAPRHPLLIVRQWASLTTAGVKKHLLGKYEPLYVMIKHNAEHIASEVPDGRTRAWIDLGVPCLVNMHMISEVGPFRWSPPHFINRICLIYQAIGARGIHLYPHWPWRTPGSGEIDYPSHETQRDRLYHEAFGRYSFDPVRDQDEEERFWARRYREYYGEKYVTACLDAMNWTARSLTRLQQHLWIHYDNHSILSAGYRLGDLYFARSMQGRKVVFTEIGNDLIPLYADLALPERDWGHGVPIEDSLAISISDVDSAIEILETAGVDNAPPDSEAGFLLRDLLMTSLVLRHLNHKTAAVRCLDRYIKHGELDALEQAYELLEKSVSAYRDLATDEANPYTGISDVNPVIPIPIDVEKMRLLGRAYHWREILPVFEEELAMVGIALSSARDSSDQDEIRNNLKQDLNLT